MQIFANQNIPSEKDLREFFSPLLRVKNGLIRIMDSKKEAGRFLLNIMIQKGKQVLKRLEIKLFKVTESKSRIWLPSA